MNTRAIAAEYRLSHWAQIMQERISSGMSIKGYCKSAGICEQVYYYWQRKLREAACQELAAAEKKSEKGLVPSGWAVCKTTETTATQALVVEIGIFRISVEADTAPELLAKTCRVLKSLC
jgi:putative transposase